MYYFAYGSNLIFEQMRRLCGWHFQVVGVAVLKGYKMHPDTRGFLGIQPEEGSKVFGLIYSVDQFCIDSLDDFEGHPDVFIRTQVKVTDIAGEDFTAWVYIEQSKYFDGKFLKPDFLNRIIGAADSNHLPKEWIKFLESLKSFPAN
jgi:gamma-glutamylcyclotransferase (GGCT)/AIG2-like uncharacterized protein YtfP